MPAAAKKRTPAAVAAPLLPTKPRTKSLRREGAILVLLEPSEKRMLGVAAKKVGLGIGTWLRSIGLERARDLLLKK